MYVSSIVLALFQFRKAVIGRTVHLISALPLEIARINKNLAEVRVWGVRIRIRVRVRFRVRLRQRELGSGRWRGLGLGLG